MKKMLLGLAVAMLLAAPVAQADDLPTDNKANHTTATNPADQFTGKYWVNSKPENQEAYLYGIESAIEVEKVVNSKQVALAAKEGKKRAYALSPFVKGWMTAFKDVPRKDIRESVDRWYAEHPDELARPVLNVIWFELIAPKLKAGK